MRFVGVNSADLVCFVVSLEYRGLAEITMVVGSSATTGITIGLVWQQSLNPLNQSISRDLETTTVL